MTKERGLTVLQTADLETIMQLPVEANERMQRAQKYYDTVIIDMLKISPESYTDENDHILSSFISAISTTVSELKDKRSPFFRAVDEYRSRLTTIESHITSLGVEAKRKRDDVVTWRHNRQKEEERIAAEKLRIKSLLIDYRNQVQMMLFSKANNSLKEFSDLMISTFNKSTLENIELIRDRLSAILNERYNMAWGENTIDGVRFSDIPQSDRELIYKEECEKFDINPIVQKRMELIRSYLDKIPNKIEELRAEQAADIEEKERIEREREAFAKAEKERIDRELADSLAAQEAESKLASETEKGNSLFDAIVVPEAVVPKGSREDVELNITTLDGYTKVIALWLRHEAPTIKLEDMPKKAISTMITFAKRHYLSTGEKIECSGLQYIDKVSTRSAKRF